MNIEIANRLVNLRKSNGLSQEALAEKLGISRQAVSKWERAEASPDTDNLILLARLYKVSLDELLRTEDEIPAPEHPGEGTEESKGTREGKEDPAEKGAAESGSMYGNPSEHTEDKGEAGEEAVHLGLDGIYVKDKDGSAVRVGLDGIYVEDRKNGDNVHIDKDGAYVNGKKYGREQFLDFRFISVTCSVTLLYLFLGFFWGIWHPTWMLFLLIPLWYSLVEAIRHRKPDAFAYPILAVLVFLCMGFFFGAWHPGWVVFLTVPVYYSAISSRPGKSG